MKTGWKIGAAALAAVAAVSLATPPPQADGAARPLFAGAAVEPRVLGVFERACADCHSERTRYPWYSYVAPVSLLVRHDVVRGRGWLNMSRWSEYPLVRKQRLLSEIANQVQDRDMPLRQYTLIHRDARLSDEDVDAVFRWTQKERARLIQQQFGQNTQD